MNFTLTAFSGIVSREKNSFTLSLVNTHWTIEMVHQPCKWIKVVESWKKKHIIIAIVWQFKDEKKTRNDDINYIILLLFKVTHKSELYLNFVCHTHISIWWWRRRRRVFISHNRMGVCTVQCVDLDCVRAFEKRTNGIKSSQNWTCIKWIFKRTKGCKMIYYAIFAHRQTHTLTHPSHDSEFKKHTVACKLLAECMCHKNATRLKREHTIKQSLNNNNNRFISTFLHILFLFCSSSVPAIAICLLMSLRTIHD